MPIARILIFDDDQDVREIWSTLVDSPVRVECFSCWEEFERAADPSLVQGAAAFVDGNFEKADSKYGGAYVARRLRELGVAKLYSISANPRKLGEAISLFDAILGTKFPDDLRKLL